MSPHPRFPSPLVERGIGGEANERKTVDIYCNEVELTCTTVRCFDLWILFTTATISKHEVKA